MLQKPVTRWDLSNGLEHATAERCYQYDKLNPNGEYPFRLLAVQPGETSKVGCRLSEFELHSAARPRYKALSYTWGTESPSKCIHVDGQAFPVRRNLWTFLRRFQLQRQPVLIWIDAICINQNDVKERNQQVRIMDHIYVEAEEVIAWLGDDPLGVTRALMEQTQDNMAISSDWHVAISELVSRPYWNRAWIVQELLLAKGVKLWFGSKGIVDLKAFESWYRAVQSNSTFKGNTNLDQILAYGTVRPKGASNLDTRDRSIDKRHLANLLISFADTECSDQRDKVFAFLGLQRMFGRRGILVDYAQSPVLVYFDVLEWCEAEYVPDYGPHKSFRRALQRSMGLADDEVGRPLRRGWMYHLNLRRRLGKVYIQRILDG